MSPAARRAYAREHELAGAARRARRWGDAMRHLERAHVLGQRRVVPHVVTHARMLEVELRRRSTGAALGQLARILLGAAGSAVGRVPVGNTGGSDVDMFRPMPIPEDLRVLLEEGTP